MDKTIANLFRAGIVQAGLLLLCCLPAQADKLHNLWVERRANPEGVSVAQPRFSWQIESNRKDVSQAAYRIEVAADKQSLAAGKGLLWDSGRTASDRSQEVAYGGRALQPATRYYWRVTVWTNEGKQLRSPINQWGTALADAAWKAQWIGLDDSTSLQIVDKRTILPLRYLRKEFSASQKPRRAMLYVSGVGSSYCYLNGKRVGNDVFGPLPTWYYVSVPYLTFDVTSLVKQGSNALGVELGNGRYLTMRTDGFMVGFGLPRLIAQLELEYPDGTKSTLVSDESWKATNRGPITANNEFDGETYDARLGLGRWTEAGYDDSAWSAAQRMAPPKGKLVSQLSPSLKVMEELPAQSVKKVGDDRYIVDMGQNMVGVEQVKFRGRKGVPVKMRFAEVLKDNGTELYLDNLRTAQVTDTYIPDRDGEFAYTPSFVYHGYRFMEVTGAEGVTAKNIKGHVVYDEMATIGTFETSNALLNQLVKNAYWGIRGNYRGMPTDCPQRDERQGWLGDRTTGAYGESFLLNNNLLYRKWLTDIEESMNEHGSISNASPAYWPMPIDDVTWPAAYFYVADMLYHQFGDDYSICHRYPSMKKWVNHVTATKMKDYIMTKDEYGDWCMPPESPELIHSQDPARKTNGEVLATTVFYSILQLMQKFAGINGLPADAQQYADLAAKVKEAYNKKFFHAGKAQYDNNTVTANLLSLRLGLVPAGYEQRVFANVVEKTEKDCNGHVSVGVMGIQHLMRGLTQYGAKDLAYRIATNDTYPSWGYMIRRGATTIWELWNGDTADPAMNSRNHVMLLGDLLIWCYEDLAGIKNDPSGVAFKKILMEPAFPEGLTHVNASYDCPYGKITSNWQRSGNRLTWHIAIPANTTATVKIPADFRIDASTAQRGIRSVATTDGKQVITLGSGSYTLRSKQ